MHAMAEVELGQTLIILILADIANLGRSSKAFQVGLLASLVPSPTPSFSSLLSTATKSWAWDWVGDYLLAVYILTLL